MLLKTLIENQNQMEVAEVEIQLIAGLPQIHFLGLPDRVIKESFFRIKSALKSSGFQFPVSQQVIVNVRPNAMKKSSQGLELAVALARLDLTDQKKIPDSFKNCLIYGELELDGGVREPLSLSNFRDINKYCLLTGRNDLRTDLVTNQSLDANTQIQSQVDQALSRQHQGPFQRLSHLKEEWSWRHLAQQDREPRLERPQGGLDLYFSQSEAELLFLMATTQLHTLLSGRAGAGKSFLAQNYSSFLMAPESDDQKVRLMADRWYPHLMPHHSLTPAAFLGGGVNGFRGEIERVGAGVLVLDELLEFDHEILEALREPMTGQTLRLARSGWVKEVKPEFQVVATTNLCPCGKWTPNTIINCRFSLQQCKGYLNRLSGPLLDRFGLIYFHQRQQPRTVRGWDVLRRIEAWTQLRASFTAQQASQLSQRGAPDLCLSSDLQAPGVFEEIYPDISGRRLRSLLKVAGVYALERKSDCIELEDLRRSDPWTVRGFFELDRGMC